jgi:hypothetical protein
MAHQRIARHWKKIKVLGMQISKIELKREDRRTLGTSHEVAILQHIGALKPVLYLDEAPIVSAPAPTC